MANSGSLEKRLDDKLAEFENDLKNCQFHGPAYPVHPDRDCIPDNIILAEE